MAQALGPHLGERALLQRRLPTTEGERRATTVKKTDYSNLRELLAQEIFPQSYVHKFIGNATPAFAEGVAALEAAFPTARPPPAASRTRRAPTASRARGS